MGQPGPGNGKSSSLPAIDENCSENHPDVSHRAKRRTTGACGAKGVARRGGAGWFEPAEVAPPHLCHLRFVNPLALSPEPRLCFFPLNVSVKWLPVCCVLRALRPPSIPQVVFSNTGRGARRRWRSGGGLAGPGGKILVHAARRRGWGLPSRRTSKQASDQSKGRLGGAAASWRDTCRTRGGELGRGA